MSGPVDGYICVASGASASVNSVSWWTCKRCGASILTTTHSYVGDSAFGIHNAWHDSAGQATQ